MLSDQWGSRKFTREECALLEEGAKRLAGDLIPEAGYATLVAEFDRMSLEEKLVALHALCIRVASDEEPKGREMWQDATLMAVLQTLEAHVEIAFDLVQEDQEWARAEVAVLTRLILASRLSCECDLEAIRSVPREERAELDQALLQMHESTDDVPTVSREVLLEILEEYKELFFPDWDFMGSEAALDLSPRQYEQLTKLMGVDAGYHLNTAPSCSPQAVRAAREFLFDDQSERNRGTGPER
ncbi:hypothetical protein ACXR0O_25265 [Verrucomicrobiota bacterium sgz303538]